MRSTSTDVLLPLQTLTVLLLQEAGHRNMLAQAEDLEVRQREIAKLEQGFAQKEKKLQDLQNRSNGRLNNIRGALEKTMEENDSLRHAFLQVKVVSALGTLAKLFMHMGSFALLPLLISPTLL